MFGTLPKIFDKNFVIGFFVPALLAIFAIDVAFPTITAKVLGPLHTLTASEKNLDDLTYIVLCIWLAAILLMTVNYMLYRIMEGYFLKLYTRPFLWLSRVHFKKLKTRYDKLMGDWSDDDEQERIDLGTKLNSKYPSSEGEVKPTQFGNVIRSFETYPYQVYGVDTVPVWLRLASVIPKEFTSLLNDARAQVDFLVNLTFIAFIIAIGSLAAAGYDLDWHQMPAWSAVGIAARRHIVVTIIVVLFSRAAYCGATASAMAWGELVKSAFDCYLPSLIRQLGYVVPVTEDEQREFWCEFNALITYRQAMTAGRWQRVKEPDPIDDKADVSDKKRDVEPNLDVNIDIKQEADK